MFAPSIVHSFRHAAVFPYPFLLLLLFNCPYPHIAFFFSKTIKVGGAGAAWLALLYCYWLLYDSAHEQLAPCSAHILPPLPKCRYRQLPSLPIWMRRQCSLDIGLWGFNVYFHSSERVAKLKLVLLLGLCNYILSWVSTFPLNPFMFVLTRKTVGGWASVLFSKRISVSRLKNLSLLLYRLIAKLLKWLESKPPVQLFAPYICTSAHPLRQSPSQNWNPLRAHTNVWFLNPHLWVWKVKS